MIDAIETSFKPSLAALKRYIKPGQSYYSTLFYYDEGDSGPYRAARDYGKRYVAHVDTVKFGFHTHNASGTTVSYCEWPKAKQLMFISDGSIGLRFRINFPGGFLVYSESGTD